MPCGDERTQKIYENMRAYYDSGLFYEVDSFVSVERKFASGKVRRGLVAAVDLTKYEFAVGNKALIRATEGTVVDRLPPRVKIRRESLLELPHIMLLLDDPQNTVFKAVDCSLGKTLYDFELNAGGGHIIGKEVTDSETVLGAFEQLKKDMHKRFGEDLLMLVGDGNHSLAAAKKCYEEAVKSGDENAELKRYALCEIVNLYDEGIVFEPIHRAVFGVAPDKFAEYFARKTADMPLVGVVRGGGKEYRVKYPRGVIEQIAATEKIIEEYIAKFGGSVDYIHGDDVLSALSEREDCVTVKFLPISKDGFTEYIISNGVLPKKTFSMGNAEEKRYYLEARKIRK